MTFPSRERPYRLWDPPCHSVDIGEFKRPGREADNSPSSPSNVNNVRPCNCPLICAFMTSTGTTLTWNSRSKQILFISGYTFLENVKFLSIECSLFTSVRRKQRSAFGSVESYCNRFFREIVTSLGYTTCSSDRSVWWLWLIDFIFNTGSLIYWILI